jgi:hypothetical protein
MVYCDTSFQLSQRRRCESRHRVWPSAPRISSALRVALRDITAHVTGKIRIKPRLYRHPYGLTGKITPGGVYVPICPGLGPGGPTARRPPAHHHPWALRRNEAAHPGGRDGRADGIRVPPQEMLGAKAANAALAGAHSATRVQFGFAPVAERS